MQPLTGWLLLFFLPVQAEPATSIFGFDEIVVVFEEIIITKSDMTIDQALEQRLPIQSSVLQAVRENSTLEGLIQLEAIKDLAGDSSLYQAKSEDVQQRYHQFRSQWTSEAEFQSFLQTNGITTERIQTKIQKQIVAEQYVSRNLGIPNQASTLDEDKYYSWLLQTKEQYAIRYVGN